jgi:putative tricarboxylic transport membrane protein
LYKKYPALFLLFFSIYVCVVSWRLGLGSLHKPGSGFMPFWSAVLIAILAVILLVQEIRSARTAAQEERREKPNWKSIGLTLLFFLAYILLLEYVGFVVGTVLFIGATLKIIEKKGWLLSTWVSVAMAFACYYIFKVWLQAELPRGLFGF